MKGTMPTWSALQSMQIVEVATSGTIGTDRMGPVSTDICSLSNKFAERGHDVTVADARGEGPRRFLHPRVRLVELNAPPKDRIASRSRNQAAKLVRRSWHAHRFVRELSSKLDLSQADVVHFHAPLPAFFARRLHGLNSVCYTAHTPTWSIAPTLRRGPISRLTKWVECDVIRRSRVTIGLGRYLADALPNSNVVTIPNGLDFSAWPPIERSEAREALGIAEGAFVLLFVGRISPIKGVDTLIDAVRRVAASLPELSVFVIGPLSGAFDTRDEHVNPYARAMLERARDLPVRLLGFVSNRGPEFRQYLAASDAFVLPSRSEPQGLVVLEALAMGTPVIGSATGGIPEMVSNDVGHLFPPEDVTALAECIRRTYNDRERLRNMRSAIRASVEQRYSWDATADRYLAVFEQSSTGAEAISPRPP